MRKFRWNLEGRGKRGGARVIHFYHSENMPIILLSIYAKNEKSDLKDAEAKALGRFALEMVREYKG